MPATPREHILLIGDHDRNLQAALTAAVPTAEVDAVAGMFDGIHELSTGAYSTVLAAAEPIERRPEAAVRTLRELIGQGRLLLFGHPTLEPLSRKMLQFGVDDYVVTPTSASELQELFGMPLLRIAAPPDDQAPAGPPLESVGGGMGSLLSLPMAEILLESLVKSPRNALPTAVEAINGRMAQTIRLSFTPTGSAAPIIDGNSVLLSHTMRVDDVERATMHLAVPRAEDQVAARHFLSEFVQLSTRLITLQERHVGLEQLAITDDLTGLYNSRYFKHCLRRLCEQARQRIHLVTLLLFDIDNFKKYNDEYGHALGDEILRQTASLMKRCCRQQDQVFRIAGDEFAVVFVEKDPPRQAHDPASASGARVPGTIKPILERFRRSIANPEFAMLGAHGRGRLTISGGMAIFPHHAATPEGLIEAADEALMFHAKKGGKDSIHLVGGNEPTA